MAIHCHEAVRYDEDSARKLNALEFRLDARNDVQLAVNAMAARKAVDECVQLQIGLQLAADPYAIFRPIQISRGHRREGSDSFDGDDDP